MLYLFDKYISENPARDLSGALRFDKSSKNFHEMTVEEINKGFTGVTYAPRSARNVRNQIKLYLQWLKENGVECDPQLADEITIPEQVKQYLIYSAEDIHKYYKLLFASAKIVSGIYYSENNFLMSYASGILSFYGVTPEQIIDLDYDDVTEEGVKGFDLPLTEKDMEIILRYKNYRVQDVAKHRENKYIRNAVIDLQPKYLSYQVYNAKLTKEYTYLRPLLNVTNLYTLGGFARIYEIEKKSDVKIKATFKAPDYFVEIACQGKGVSTIQHTKADYIAYRTERDAAKMKAEIKESIAPKPRIVETVQRPKGSVATVPNEIDVLKKEILDCLDTMHGLEMKLRNLMNQFDSLIS